MPEDEEILLSLVQGQEGEDWASRRVGWVKDEAKVEKACTWQGIECDSKMDVVAIVIPTSDLSATIPSMLGKLTSLKRIDMSKNIFYGTIPTEVAQLPNMEIFNLKQNKLTGTLPPFTSTKLKILDISLNILTGKLPSNIASPESIEQLILKENKLDGTIPQSFTQMTNLGTIDMSANSFSGTIPDDIQNLRLLQFLYLDNNFLMGYIPSTIVRPHTSTAGIGNLLEKIWLHDNLLSGTIPVVLAELDKLVDLYLDGNKLTGTVPSDLCLESLNKDFFQYLDENENRDLCHSISCPANTAALEGVHPCLPCSSPHYNPYLGKTGRCNDLNQRKILNLLYESTNIGEGWNGDDINWHDDEVFICDFTGVTCDENNEVIEIRLRDRGLRGVLPGEIGFLRYLQVLDVSDNELVGFVPSDLRWAPLRHIDVSGNKMKGIVPLTLCSHQGINGNGKNGNFNCEHIACPIGTFSKSGRLIPEEDDFCLPCGPLTPPYLGSTSCSYSIKKGRLRVTGIFGVTIAFVILCIFSAFMVPYCVLRRKRKEEQINGGEGSIAAQFSSNQSQNFIYNSRGVASLPYANGESNGTTGNKSTNSKKPVRKSYHKIPGNMPPPMEPLSMGGTSSTDDAFSIRSGSSKGSRSSRASRGSAASRESNESTDSRRSGAASASSSKDLSYDVSSRDTSVVSKPEPKVLRTNKEDWLDVPKI